MDTIKQFFNRLMGTSEDAPSAAESAGNRARAAAPPIKGADTVQRISYPASLETVVDALEKAGASEWTIEALRQEGVDTFASADEVNRIIGRVA